MAIPTGDDIRRIEKRLRAIDPTLTPHELSVCALLLEHKSVCEISHILSISENTVKFHKKNIRRKLKVKEGENLSLWLISLL